MLFRVNNYGRESVLCIPDHFRPAIWFEHEPKANSITDSMLDSDCTFIFTTFTRHTHSYE